MSRHVPEAALIDLLEGGGSSEGRRHLEACPVCGDRFGALRGGLELARSTEVPEPSPLYWESFRRQVGQKIQAAPEPSRHRVLLWAPALMAAAAVIAVVALGPLSPHVRPSPGAQGRLPAWSPLPPAEEDDTIGLLDGAAASEDEIALGTEPYDFSSVVAALSDDDGQALADALQRELRTGVR
jgi:hypothetical protein